MLKFLRKYNKWILVVGGAFLMVAFLLPQTLQELGRGIGSRTTYLKVDGRRISAEDADLGRRELAALKHMQLGLVSRTDDLDTWLVATYEASKAGLIGGPQAGREEVPGLAGMIAQQVYFQMLREGQRPDEARVQELARNVLDRNIAGAAAEGHLTMDQMYAAIAKVRGLARLRVAYGESLTRVSDRRAIIEGKHDLDSAKIDYVFLTADRMNLPVPTPDDAALQAQFDRFKGVKKGEGDFGIGYTLPPRVKLEFLTLDRSSWDMLVTVNPLDVRNRYLRDNKAKPNVTASGPEFEAARPGIEAQIRKETLDKAMSEATKTIRAEIAKSTVRLDRSGDYFTLPPDWDARKPDLNAIRDQVAARVRSDAGLDIQPPVLNRKDAAWLDAQELASLPGIGQALLKRGNSTIPFPQLATQVREIAGPSPIGLQVGVPYGPIEDYSGNQYFFTILDARKESPPDAWTDVRDTLAKDFRMLEGFRLLEKDADAYKQRAVAGGVDAVAKDLLPRPDADPAKPVDEVHRGITVSRQSAPQPEIDTDAVKNAVIEAASKFDPTVTMDLFDPAMRTLAIPVPQHLGLAVIRVTTYIPLTTEKYRVQDRSLASSLAADMRKELKDDPFSPARLKERLHVEVPDSRKKAEQQQQPADDSGA